MGNVGRVAMLKGKKEGEGGKKCKVGKEGKLGRTENEG